MPNSQTHSAPRPAKWIAVTAMLMAMNIALSSFGMPVPGGHLYLNDIVICTAAILLDPLGAFLVGGASLLAAHLGFTVSVEPEMLPALMGGKLCGAAVSVVLALCAFGNVISQQKKDG